MTKLALEASSLENPFNRGFGSNVMSMGTKRTDICIARHPQEHPAVFAARFSRCRPLLRSIACCVLNDTQRAEVAIESCWLSASRNPPRFEYEGAFRSWLLRVLIDEALAILRKKISAEGTVLGFYRQPTVQKCLQQLLQDLLWGSAKIPRARVALAGAA